MGSKPRATLHVRELRYVRSTHSVAVVAIYRLTCKGATTAYGAWCTVALATRKVSPWILTDGSLPGSATSTELWACSLSAGGARVSTGTAGGAACVWNVADGSLVRVLCAAGPRVVSVAVTSTSAVVCTSRDDDLEYTCTVYNLATGGVTWKRVASSPVHHVYLVPALLHHWYQADSSLDPASPRE